jgi:hypothetical protein
MDLELSRREMLKVKFALELSVKAQRGSKDIAVLVFFNLGPRRGWVVDTKPWAALLLGKRCSAHFAGGCVDPRIGLNRWVKPYHPSPRDSIPRLLSP